MLGVCLIHASLFNLMKLMANRCVQYKNPIIDLGNPKWITTRNKIG
jgi:hypothetical protein